MCSVGQTVDFPVGVIPEVVLGVSKSKKKGTKTKTSSI